MAQQLDEEGGAQLLAAFRTAQNPIGRHVPLAELIEAYGVAGFYYSLAKDAKRRTTSGEKLDAQLTEDYMESLCKLLDKALMVSMHVGKMERFGT